MTGKAKSEAGLLEDTEGDGRDERHEMSTMMLLMILERMREGRREECI